MRASLEQCHVPVDPSKDGAEEQFREMLIDCDTEEQTKGGEMPLKMNLSILSQQDGLGVKVRITPSNVKIWGNS